MTALEALQTYCAICAHKDVCWRPCPVVYLAMQQEETNHAKT